MDMIGMENSMAELTQDDLRDIQWNDHEDYESVTKEEITDQSRWATYFEQVFKHIPSGKFYKIIWSRGSTEYQDVDPEYMIWEVKPVEKTITVYERV